MNIRTKLLSAFERYAFAAYYRIKVAKCLNYSKINTNRLLKAGVPNDLENLPLAQYQNSNTLFILGSGASVCRLSPSQWAAIGDNLSIGINYWAYHDFTPDLYMLELIGELNALWRILNRKSSAYDNVPLIIKGNFCPSKIYGDVENKISQLDPSLQKNLYAARDFEIPGGSRTSISKALNRLHKNGTLSKKDSFQDLCQTRGSVICAILMGVQLGCKNIVLTGVDLNNTDYFFMKEKERYESQGYSFPDMGQTDQVHLTNLRRPNRITIEEVIYEIQEKLTEFGLAQLYVANRYTALHPKLDEFEWKTNP